MKTYVHMHRYAYMYMYVEMHLYVSKYGLHLSKSWLHVMLSEFLKSAAALHLQISVLVPESCQKCLATREVHQSWVINADTGSYTCLYNHSYP